MGTGCSRVSNAVLVLAAALLAPPLAARGLVEAVGPIGITVSELDRSVRFSRDALGLTVAGTSENWGPEQERLNQVFGARLRITTLRAAAGPGIELLEYLAPSDGRPMPRDTRANDLWHWHTRLGSGPVERAADALRPPESDWVSPGVIDIEPDALGIDVGLLVRDPDGHALLIVR